MASVVAKGKSSNEKIFGNKREPVKGIATAIERERRLAGHQISSKEWP